MAAPVAHEPFAQDRSTMFTCLSHVWPIFDGLEIRKGRDLVTKVLDLWLTDTREVDMWAFAKRWALQEAQLREYHVSYDRNEDLGALWIRDWFPDTEGRMGGEHWRDYVVAQPIGRKTPRGLVSIRNLVISAEGGGFAQWLAVEAEPGWLD
jgi:hypothetical protein